MKRAATDFRTNLKRRKPIPPPVTNNTAALPFYGDTADTDWTPQADNDGGRDPVGLPGDSANIFTADKSMGPGTADSAVLSDDQIKSAQATLVGVLDDELEWIKRKQQDPRTNTDQINAYGFRVAQLEAQKNSILSSTAKTVGELKNLYDGTSKIADLDWRNSLVDYSKGFLSNDYLGSLLKLQGVQLYSDQITDAIKQYSMMKSIYAPDQYGSASLVTSPLRYAVMNKEQKGKYDLGNKEMLFRLTKEDIMRFQSENGFSEIDEGIDISKASPEIRQKYYEFVASKTTNKILNADLGKRIAETAYNIQNNQKGPGLTKDDLVYLRDMKDSYVIEKDYNFYLIKRDDPDWNVDDANRYNLQLQRSGNSIYESGWDVFNKVVAYGGLALAGVSLLTALAPLAAGAFSALSAGAATAGLVEGAAGVGVAAGEAAAGIAETAAGIELGTLGAADAGAGTTVAAEELGTTIVSTGNALPTTAISEVGTGWGNLIEEEFGATDLFNGPQGWQYDELTPLLAENASVAYEATGTFLRDMGSLFTGLGGSALRGVRSLVSTVVAEASTVAEASQFIEMSEIPVNAEAAATASEEVGAVQSVQALAASLDASEATINVLRTNVRLLTEGSSQGAFATPELLHQTLNDVGIIETLRNSSTQARIAFATFGEENIVRDVWTVLRNNSSFASQGELVSLLIRQRASTYLPRIFSAFTLTGGEVPAADVAVSSANTISSAVSTAQLAHASTTPALSTFASYMSNALVSSSMNIIKMLTDSLGTLGKDLARMALNFFTGLAGSIISGVGTYYVSNAFYSKITGDDQLSSDIAKKMGFEEQERYFNTHAGLPTGLKPLMDDIKDYVNNARDNESLEEFLARKKTGQRMISNTELDNLHDSIFDEDFENIPMRSRAGRRFDDVRRDPGYAY
jgi:hypothetical protein